MASEKVCSRFRQPSSLTFRLSSRQRTDFQTAGANFETARFLNEVKDLSAAAGFVAESIQSAKEAGLRYVSDAKPGFTRRRSGKDFIYFDPDGKRLKEQNELVRIKRLGIPPAWENVWICRFESGHLQASGRDIRGRKQYRYHTRWRQVRDETKFERMIKFGKSLPKIRRSVQRDLARPGMPREKVLATIVRLLETTLIRIGNEEYARENKSFGLTTMRNRHVKVSSTKLHFEFRGKSGKHHEIDVRDSQLARIVKRCRDLPGHELFEYIGEDGSIQTVDSGDVNEYLRGLCGEECTAKDFRTWTATVLAMVALKEFEKFATSKEAKSNVTTAIEAVSRMLGNTPAICRKCYIHPDVVNSYMDGSLIETLHQRAEQKLSRELSRLKPEEAAVLMFLEGKLSKAGATRGAALAKVK